MTYVARDIKDRIAIGDDLFQLEDLGQGKVRLTPTPTEVIEAGSDINKALLQPMEDAIAQMMNTPIDLSNYYTKTETQQVVDTAIDALTQIEYEVLKTL